MWCFEVSGMFERYLFFKVVIGIDFKYASFS